MIKNEQIFPVVLIGLMVCAAGVAAWCGDWRRCVYWLAGAVLNVAVTF